jgi:hypothetical protein
LSLDEGALAHDERMPKSVRFVAAWFLAGIVAVAVASVGVSMVGHEVIGSRPAPLSADQVSEELAATDGSPDATTTSTTSTTSTTAPERTSTSTVPPATGGGPGTTVAPPVSQPGGSPTTTVAPPPPATTKTYDLVGGTATLRFSASGVTVVVATPNAGFSVKSGQSHGNGVQLEFESDDHRSRVDAWWDGGPQDEVREED